MQYTTSSFLVVNQVAIKWVSLILMSLSPASKDTIIDTLVRGLKKVRLCFWYWTLLCPPWSSLFRLGGKFASGPASCETGSEFWWLPSASKERNEPTKANSPWKWILAWILGYGSCSEKGGGEGKKGDWMTFLARVEYQYQWVQLIWVV